MSYEDDKNKGGGNPPEDGWYKLFQESKKKFEEAGGALADTLEGQADYMKRQKGLDEHGAPTEFWREAKQEDVEMGEGPYDYLNDKNLPPEEKEERMVEDASAAVDDAQRKKEAMEELGDEVKKSGERSQQDVDREIKEAEQKVYEKTSEILDKMRRNDEQSGRVADSMDEMQEFLESLGGNGDAGVGSGEQAV